MNKLAGSFWPNDQQKLLLRAALMDAEQSAVAWGRVRPTFDLDDPDHASQALLPLVYRQLHRFGIDDPGLPKLRGIYRRTWYMNQLLLDRLKGTLEAVEAGGGDPLIFSSWELPLRYYDDLGLRSVAALHLLVRPDRVARSAQALADQGWTGPLDSRTPSSGAGTTRATNGRTVIGAVLYWRLFHEFSDPGRGIEPDDLWEQPIGLELRGRSRSSAESD